MSYSGQEVVTGILYLLGQKEGLKITTNTPALHQVFYDFSCRKKYKKLLSGLLWQDRIFGKYSDNLDTCLWCLTMASCLSEMDDNYIVLPRLHYSWEHHDRAKFSPEELKLLDDLANEMAKELETDLKTKV